MADRSSKGNCVHELRGAYTETRVVKDAESPCTFRKGETFIFSYSASAPTNALCYSVPASPARYRRTPPLLLPSILAELLVAS